MPPPRSGKSIEVSVKSSLRTLQILEFMDSKQRGVTIAELAASLHFPQSSTSTLVQSMINAGYLVVDPDGRRILPSSRVAALGSWVEPLVSHADIRALMVAIGQRTNQTILLGRPRRSLRALYRRGARPPYDAPRHSPWDRACR